MLWIRPPARNREDVARGLEISADRAWDYKLEKYVANPDLPRKLESNARTAIEDVSNTATISTFF